MTGRSGSLLARMEERGKLPKIMFTNTSAEYWRGDAALIHTDLEKMSDHVRGSSVPPHDQPMQVLHEAFV